MYKAGGDCSCWPCEQVSLIRNGDVVSRDWYVRYKTFKNSARNKETLGVVYFEKAGLLKFTLKQIFKHQVNLKCELDLKLILKMSAFRYA